MIRGRAFAALLLLLLLLPAKAQQAPRLFEVLADHDSRYKIQGQSKPSIFLVEIKDGKGKATSVFSLDKGCFVSQKSAMEMTIAVQGQAMPMKTVVELTLVSRK